MPKYTKLAAAMIAAGAVVSVPVTGAVAKEGQGKGKTKRCAKASTVGYQVGGTLVSVTPDNPATPASEATVTMLVTSANSHARNSGEIADQDAAKKGVQVKGATYTVPAGDAYTLKLNDYEAPDTPSVGDRVKVSGRIPVTKKKCAPAGTSTADRYAAPDVRKVTISDRDADA